MILTSVRKEKKYGYEILKDLRKIYEDVWEPKTGVIYPAIKKLQEMNMLDSETIDGREHYSLSEEGRVWLINALPAYGAMSSVRMRFITVLLEASGDFGKEPGNSGNETLSDEDRLRLFTEMRDRMEKELMNLNELIEKIPGGDR